jgi:hypothetical protein
MDDGLMRVKSSGWLFGFNESACRRRCQDLGAMEGTEGGIWILPAFSICVQPASLGLGELV